MTVVAPGVVRFLTYTPGRVFPPASGSAPPAGDASARCRPETGQPAFPVFFRTVVSVPLGLPGDWISVGALDRETSAASYSGTMWNQRDRSPSL